MGAAARYFSPCLAADANTSLRKSSRRPSVAAIELLLRCHSCRLGCEPAPVYKLHGEHHRRLLARRDRGEVVGVRLVGEYGDVDLIRVRVFREALHIGCPGA